ncbi:hypothetical protein LP420_33250 [Massilia sp. B-10]|nr:hypothetical protein LP420_33250 [Massilia sp. B-10]
MPAYFAEGATAYNAKNYSRAQGNYTAGQGLSNAEAQHLLGLMYYMGRGVSRDFRAGAGLAPQGGRAGQGRCPVRRRRHVLHR